MGCAKYERNLSCEPSDEHRLGIRSRGSEKGSHCNPQGWQENSCPAPSRRIGWCLGDRAFVAVTQQCAAVAESPIAHRGSQKSWQKLLVAPAALLRSEDPSVASLREPATSLRMAGSVKNPNSNYS